jgi:hypothetical protein
VKERILPGHATRRDTRDVRNITDSNKILTPGSESLNEILIRVGYNGIVAESSWGNKLP